MATDDASPELTRSFLKIIYNTITSYKIIELTTADPTCEDTPCRTTCRNMVPKFGKESWAIEGVGVALVEKWPVPLTDPPPPKSESPSKSVMIFSRVGIEFNAGIEYSSSSSCKAQGTNINI